MANVAVTDPDQDLNSNYYDSRHNSRAEMMFRKWHRMTTLYIHVPLVSRCLQIISLLHQSLKAFLDTWKSNTMHD